MILFSVLRFASRLWRRRTAVFINHNAEVTEKTNARRCGEQRYAPRAVSYDKTACRFNLIENAIYGVLFLIRLTAENIDGFERCSCLLFILANGCSGGATYTTTRQVNGPVEKLTPYRPGWASEQAQDAGLIVQFYLLKSYTESPLTCLAFTVTCNDLPVLAALRRHWMDAQVETNKLRPIAYTCFVSRLAFPR